MPASNFHLSVPSGLIAYSLPVDTWFVVVGKPAVREFLLGMFTRVPDIRWDEIRHYVHPDVAVVEWITSGTPHGGTRFEVYGCDVLALRDGRIAAKRSFRKGVI